eukprot:NODE_9535_length_582_cov_200.599129_g8898_i0.p1 GENE.NODE_9535_length_582_cov_200.599129_g8898_i0~~NODE_9535_length_582_cov_200.599129_g8898_i0.p1  ORF type:complete len:113 (-),score=20.81 NODE_9535_length_582_cov_200.599129_g8898_i0:186-524(-)
MSDDKGKANAREGNNTINISLQRSPVFYANLAKRFLHGGEAEVKLTGLGDATTTVVGAAEILKRQEGLAVIKTIETSLSERNLSRLLVVVTKGPKFDELYKPPTGPEETAKS